MPATSRTISIVQLYVRRDQMMANLRSIRSFDASVGMLSPEDRARYFGEPERVVAAALVAVTARTTAHLAECEVVVDGLSFIFATYSAERRTGRSFTTRDVVTLLPSMGDSKAPQYNRARAAAIVWLRQAAGEARIADKRAHAKPVSRLVLAAALVAACDAAHVDGFTAPPAAGITSAASTDAPPAEPSTTSDETSDETSDADATSTGAGSTSEPSTTTAAVDATSTSGGDDTTGEPDTTTTGADTTTADPSTGEASTSTGDDNTTAGDASTTGEGTSTGEPLELPPECLSYVPLTDANRNVAFGIYGPKTCDAQLAPGWYRFMGAAGSRMPTTPPPIFSCGAHAPGWMSGGPHPTVADGIVERTACYHWDNDGDGPLPDKPCWVSMPMQVRDCGEFVVYHLSPSAACMTRFCGEV